jgi:hypothetical protein
MVDQPHDREGARGAAPSVRTNDLGYSTAPTFCRPLSTSDMYDITATKIR